MSMCTAVVLLLLATPLSATTLTYVNPGSETHLTLRRSGDLLAITGSGGILASGPAATTDRIVIRGASGAVDDTLTLDLDQPITLRGGIEYDGGRGGWDTLIVEGGSARHQRVTQLTPHDGVIDIDGLVVRYSNLEPVTDTVPAASYTINATAGLDTITVSDGLGGTTTVSSPTFESLSFANKTNVTLDGQGGGDSVAFANPNPATGLVSFIVTNVATVTHASAILYPSFGVNATGAVTLNTVANDVDNVEITTQNGNIAFLDADDVSIGGVSPTLAGVRVVNSGSIDFRTSDGSIALTDPDGAEIVRAGNVDGDVFMRATASISPFGQISATVDRQAVIAPAGSIELRGGMLALGTAGDFANDVLAADAIFVETGGVIVDGRTVISSDAFGTNSGADATIRGFGGVIVDDATGTGASLRAGGNAGADLFVLTSGGAAPLTLRAPHAEALFSQSGDISITTSQLIINPDSGITAANGTVTIATFPVAANGIDLGSTTDANIGLGIEMSDAEVDRVFTPMLIFDISGPIVVTQAITFTNGTHLMLRAVQFDGTGTGNLTAQTLSFVDLGTSSSPQAFTITPASVQIEPGTPVPYSGVITLNGSGYDSRDVFFVTPSATTTINIDGNLPAPPSAGDTLDFDLTGVTDPVLTATLTPTGYQGSLTSSNRQPVNFQEIEQIVDAPVDLGITKTDGAATAVAGTAITYTITVTNSAPIPVPGATVTDVFPADLSGVEWTCTPSAGSSCTSSGSGDINETVTLAASGSVTFTVDATIDPSASGTLTNTATVAAPAGFTETNATNNTATDANALSAEADLILEKTATQSAVAPGDDLTYTITLRNAGPSDAQNVVLEDVLPANTSFVSFDAAAGYSCSTPAVGATTGSVTCTRGVLPPSPAADSFTLVVRVAATVPLGAVISNTATVTSTTPDPSPDNSATATAAAVGSIPTLSTTMIALFAALLALVALRAARVLH